MIIGLVASDYLQNKVSKYFTSKGFEMYDFKQLLTQKKQPKHRKIKKKRNAEKVDDILEKLGRRLDLVNKNYVLVNIDERVMDLFDEFDGLTIGIFNPDLKEVWQEMNREKRRPEHIKNYSQFAAEERKNESKEDSLFELVSYEIEGKTFEGMCKQLDEILFDYGLTQRASQ